MAAAETLMSAAARPRAILIIFAFMANPVIAALISRGLMLQHNRDILVTRLVHDG